MSIDITPHFVQPQDMAPQHLYCTLFDSGFASRGLSMIESLKRAHPDARVVVFCFDLRCEQILSTLSLDYVTIIPLAEFEDSELLKVKPTRTRGEYCWTSTPSTILYCLEKLKATACTYLDADLFFFNSPQPLFAKYASSSIWITDHRYSPQYDQSEISGRYCVQFMHFKNTPEGLEALRWWRNSCLDWCYARVEDGKFGDQKYLDDWPTRFNGVAEILEHGAGVAPWNLQRYDYRLKHQSPWIMHGSNDEAVIFFHFHGLKLFLNGYLDLGAYETPREAFRLIYQPYLIQLIFWEAELRRRFNFESPKAQCLPIRTRIKRLLNGVSNYFPLPKEIIDASNP